MHDECNDPFCSYDIYEVHPTETESVFAFGATRDNCISRGGKLIASYETADDALRAFRSMIEEDYDLCPTEETKQAYVSERIRMLYFEKADETGVNPIVTIRRRTSDGFLMGVF